MVSLGDRVIFYPRVPYGRQSQLAGLVTRVVGDGVIDLIAFPSGGEPLHMNGIRQRGENVQIYCWEPVETKQLVAREDDYSDLAAKFKELAERIAPLEARRGPGRPPKHTESE